MRLWLLLSVALGTGGLFAQQAANAPPWLILVASLLGSGFVGRYILARYEKRWEQRLQDATARVQEATAEETQVKTARAMEDLQTSILNRARAEHAEMHAQLEGFKTRLAEANVRAVKAEAIAAQKDTRIQALTTKVLLLEGRIEALHDQMAAKELGEEFGKRRLDEE
jgi:hypothetical protein